MSSAARAASAITVPAGPGRLRLSRTQASIAGEILYRATRWLVESASLEVHGREAVLAAKSQGRPVVFVGWHGHDFVNLGAFRPVFGPEAQGAIMVRETFGGRALCELGRRMNLQVVSLGRGSDSPRRARGVVSMIALLKRGTDALVAVDGPDGPARIAKPGAAFIAQRAGAILVPSSIACRRAVHLSGRWDDHLIPLPGTRTVVSLGPPVDAAPPDGPRPSVEYLRSWIEQALHAGAVRAEALCRGG